MTNNISRVLKSFRRRLFPSNLELEHKRWVNDLGDYKFRLDYDLNENDIVMDLGGYHGQFASDIYSRYQSKIYVFEPVNEFYEIIKDRFSKNCNITAYKFGLAASSSSQSIVLDNDASSTHSNSSGQKEEVIELIDICEWLDENSIDEISLLKINIEGGEYEILEKLIKTKRIKKIKNLQIQFHNFVPNAKDRMDYIKKKLSETHYIEYDYEFIWEGWSRK